MGLLSVPCVAYTPPFLSGLHLGVSYKILVDFGVQKGVQS